MRVRCPLASNKERTSDRWSSWRDRDLLLIVVAVMALTPTFFAARAAGEDDGSKATARATERERAIHRAMHEEAYDRAVLLVEAWLEERPDDPRMLYTLACAASEVDDREKASSALYRAVNAGFRDFTLLQRDPHLENMRGETMYAAIVEAVKRVADEEIDRVLAGWKGTFGEGPYRYEIDRERRLAFATALDDTSHAAMLRMLQREADHLIRTLFDAPPDYYVLIAVPTPADADRLFGDDDATRGRYEHGRRMLISRDIGGSLRHEFVHALHYGHMERLGLRHPHPIWIQEGLAALYEDYELDDDGTIRFLQNERSNVVKNLARIGRLRSWSDLLSMSPDEFMARPGKTYPQARSMFMFLAERGLLSRWYREYVRGFAEDQTGARAFETVFGEELDEIDRTWRAWVRRRPHVDTSVRTGDASLGIESEFSSSNDGVLISRVLPRSAAARALLRRGDVIVSMDGRATRSLTELQALVAQRTVGDRVTLRVRRRGRYFDARAILQPLRMSEP